MEKILFPYDALEEPIINTEENLKINFSLSLKI